MKLILKLSIFHCQLSVKKTMVEEQKTPFNLPPAIFVLLAVLLWSSGGLLFKLTTVSAFEVNAGRCLLAAITIGLLTYKKGLKLSGFTILTSILYALTLSCFAIANKMTTAANAIFLQYTAPIYILVLAPFVLKEKFRFADLITVALCLGGMSLFFFDSAPNNVLSPESQMQGNFFALTSGLFFGLYLLLLRHPASLRQNPAVSVFYGNWIGVLLMLPFIIANPSNWTSQDYVAVALLGIFQIGIAYFLFTYGIAKGVRSLDANLIGFVEPLLNPVWVFLFFGERPSNWAIIGGIIIISTIIGHMVVNSRHKLRAAAS
jgi:drug/metabolite transporter, DME family